MTVKINKGRAFESINLTSVMDLVFLLLIFFLVASRFAQEDRELDVVLPSASEAKPLTVAPKELFVNVEKDGKYFVDGRTIDLDELEAILRQAVANNPANQQVIIRADKRVQFDYVVSVMNACNKTGISDYTVSTAGLAD